MILFYVRRKEKESFTFSSTSFKYGWLVYMNTVYPRQDILFLCLNNVIKILSVFRLMMMMMMMVMLAASDMERVPFVTKRKIFFFWRKMKKEEEKYFLGGLISGTHTLLIFSFSILLPCLPHCILWTNVDPSNIYFSRSPYSLSRIKCVGIYVYTCIYPHTHTHPDSYIKTYIHKWKCIFMAAEMRWIRRRKERKKKIKLFTGENGKKSVELEWNWIESLTRMRWSGGSLT